MEYVKTSQRNYIQPVTNVLVNSVLWSITEQTHGNMESICFI